MSPPNLKNFKKSILHPALAAAPTATTFVADPNIVMFPPKHDPNDKAHQKALGSPIFSNVGTITPSILETVAALATFPIIEVNPADSQVTAITARSNLPEVIFISLSPIILIIFKFSIPFIIINNPMKKNKVSHSTFSNISFGFLLAITTRNIAPDNEIIASPLLIKLFKTNPINTNENIIAACFKSLGSFKLLEESNSIILAFNSLGTIICLPYIK